MARMSVDTVVGQIKEKISRDLLLMYQEALGGTKDYDKVQRLYGGISIMNEILADLGAEYEGEDCDTAYAKVAPIIQEWVIKDE